MSSGWQWTLVCSALPSHVPRRNTGAIRSLLDWPSVLYVFALDVFQFYYQFMQLFCCHATAHLQPQLFSSALADSLEVLQRDTYGHMLWTF